MKPGLTFAIGSFLALLIVSTGFSVPSFGLLVSALLYGILGWLFWSLGARVFRREASGVRGLVLGAIAMLVQLGQYAFFLSGVDRAEFGRQLLSAEVPLLTLLMFFVPFVTCAFFSPLLGHRSG